MNRRQGFTLVEMMVSLTLVLFIMVILSQAFQAGLESFRRLRGIGDMEERLRGTVTILRRDLTADHFEGKRRISDPNFWVQGPPREGFFRLWQGSPAVLEGRDGDQLPSTRAINHMLHFTVKLRGNDRQDFVSATLPPSVNPSFPNIALTNQAPDARYQEAPSEYRGQWFECAYYLRKSGTTVNPGDPNSRIGTDLFTLYRRQLVAVPDNSQLNWGSSALPPVKRGSDLAPFSELSCRKAQMGLTPAENPYPDRIYFNTPSDLTVPVRRFGMLPRSPAVTGGILKQPENAGLPSNPLVGAGEPALDAQRVYPVLGDQLTTGGWGANPYDGLPPAWQSNPWRPAAGLPGLTGADVLLSDVLSFEVKVFVPGVTSDFVDLFTLVTNFGVPQYNPVFFSPARPNAPIVYDTWSTVQDDLYPYPSDFLSNWNKDVAHANTLTAPLWRDAGGNPLRIAALQITLRVWDAGTQQTRQLTLVQEM